MPEGILEICRLDQPKAELAAFCVLLRALEVCLSGCRQVVSEPVMVTFFPEWSVSATDSYGKLSCLKVKNAINYDKSGQRFVKQNPIALKIERHRKKLFLDNFYIHDACSMAELRCCDDWEQVIRDFYLFFLCKENDSGNLPFCSHRNRQRNMRNDSTLAYLVNHDRMRGMGQLSARVKYCASRSRGEYLYAV
ncbi:MAG: hypothetical protein L3J57_15630 [Desulfuromusa sp.]|nr:hypothetical protein [Desulfuromusa sp.]